MLSAASLAGAMVGRQAAGMLYPAASRLMNVLPPAVARISTGPTPTGTKKRNSHDEVGRDEEQASPGLLPSCRHARTIIHPTPPEGVQRTRGASLLLLRE